MFIDHLCVSFLCYPLPISLFFFSCLFCIGATARCSRVTPSSALKNHSCQCSGNINGCQGLNPVISCKANALPTALIPWSFFLFFFFLTGLFHVLWFNPKPTWVVFIQEKQLYFYQGSKLQGVFTCPIIPASEASGSEASSLLGKTNCPDIKQKAQNSARISSKVPTFLGTAIVSLNCLLKKFHPVPSRALRIPCVHTRLHCCCISPKM